MMSRTLWHYTTPITTLSWIVYTNVLSILFGRRLEEKDSLVDCGGGLYFCLPRRCCRCDLWLENIEMHPPGWYLMLSATRDLRNRRKLTRFDKQVVTASESLFLAQREHRPKQHQHQQHTNATSMIDEICCRSKGRKNIIIIITYHQTHYSSSLSIIMSWRSSPTPVSSVSMDLDQCAHIISTHTLTVLVSSRLLSVLKNHSNKYE